MINIDTILNGVASHLNSNPRVDTIEKICYEGADAIEITNTLNEKKILIIDDDIFINIVLFEDKRYKKHAKGENIDIDIPNLNEVLFNVLDDFIKEF